MPRQVPRLEIAMVLLTGGLHVVSENALHIKPYFLAVAALFWSGYAVVRLRSHPDLWHVWGLRRDNLRAAAVVAAWIALPGGLVLVGLGMFRGHAMVSLHFFMTLLAYPFWALAQQFLLNAMLVRNLRFYLRPLATVAVGSLLFAMAHAPDPAVMGLSLVGGLIWTGFYLAKPNLWILSVLHGWFGTLTYHLILGRDPWTRWFG